MNKIINSKRERTVRSAETESPAEKLDRILRVDDSIYSQLCFLETTANALRHYLCDEDFEKDENYEEDLANMAMNIAENVSEIRNKIKTVILS